MVTTGPRVDIIEDHSTFFSRDALLSNSSNTLSEKLSTYHGEGFGSTDNLMGLIFIFQEFLPKDIRNVWHCPVGSDDQNIHDHVDYGWDFDFSRISGTLWLWGHLSERIFLN